MTGQWGVIADRDKGDNPRPQDIQDGDRYVLDGPFDGDSRIVRIERLVPATDERWDKIDALTREWRQAIITDDEYSEAVRALLPAPHPPTREQIAEAQAAILRQVANDEWAADPAAWGDNDRDYRNELRDRADALIQNGADR